MKNLRAFVLVFPFSLFLGFPALAAKPGDYRFELMKCNSQKIGTLWASFGHLVRSGSDEVVYFPTELVLFEKDFSSRMLFPTLEEALKVKVDVQSGRIGMDFTVPKDGGGQSHQIRLGQYDPRIKNAFMGNWTVSEAGKPDEMDLIACSAD